MGLDKLPPAGGLHRPAQTKAAQAKAEAMPRPIATNVDGIPAELRALQQWVCWRYERRKQKWTKAPISPQTGRKAKADDPSTWATYEQATERCRADSSLAGVGFEFRADGAVCGVDLDEAIDEWR